MKIRTFDFPSFKCWYKAPEKPWRQDNGKYICVISKHELFKKKYYSIEIMYRGYQGYVDYVFTDSIKINKSKKEIKKWYQKGIKKANKAWKKEIKPYIVK